jgi:hypothetical protein
MEADVKNKQKNIMILLAEDEELYQEIISQYIDSIGFKMTVVNNGKQCINELMNKPYDLILMDIEMPEKNGLETTREIRKKGINIPIIAVTSNTWKEDEIRSLKSGMNDFLAKPFNAKTLAKKIEYWGNPL